MGVPEDGGFALGCEADSGDVGGGGVALGCQGIGDGRDAGGDGGEEFVGILLVVARCSSFRKCLILSLGFEDMLNKGGGRSMWQENGQGNKNNKDDERNCTQAQGRIAGIRFGEMLRSFHWYRTR